MSNRETKLEPATLTTIAGVNERLYLTELPPQDFNFLEGLFPEFSGLQSRVWGKRLLHKYDDPIYGIFQFWTPQGYGVGLYQFEGSVDFGYWLTPNSSFDLTPLPLGMDMGGYTLNEFGLAYGGNVFNETNTCVLSFLNGGMDHSSCAPPPTNINTPDDSNGGPAGQGKRCSNNVVENDYNLADFASLQEVSGYVNQGVMQEDRDNCRDPVDGQNPPCVNFPPLPLALGTIPDPSGYVPTAITGVLSAGKNAESAANFTPASNAICFFRVQVIQTNAASNTKITINLSPFIGETLDEIVLVMTQTPGGEIEIPLEVTPDDQILNAADYLVLGAATANGNAGFDQSGSVTGDTIRTRKRQRVCVPV